MQFLRSILFKNSYSVLSFGTEAFIASVLIILPILYPNTAEAGIFSFIGGDRASAKTQDVSDAPNSQTMTVLKAVVNSNPSLLAMNDHPILISENALVAEIGPSGTASQIDDNNTSTAISLYVVRVGDTLSDIAGMYDVSINTIVWANDINRSTPLKAGQTLTILPITGVRHSVKKGDTIQGIVAKYKANLEEVLEFNDLSLSTTLKEGQTIIIPDAEMTVVSRASSGLSSAPAYSNYYVRPIKGGRKSQGLHGHNGVDLAAPVGTPIYASAGGTVIVSIQNGGYNGGYGNYVIISHPNGTQTLYSHNAKNTVAVGDKVDKGDQIGTIGMTGKTTGPHIHFEIRGARNPF